MKTLVSRSPRTEVPGADMTRDLWNTADDVWTINVWWESTQP